MKRVISEVFPTKKEIREYIQNNIPDCSPRKTSLYFCEEAAFVGLELIGDEN